LVVVTVVELGESLVAHLRFASEGPEETDVTGSRNTQDYERNSRNVDHQADVAFVLSERSVMSLNT
jgi:hypothetical protein